MLATTVTTQGSGTSFILIYLAIFTIDCVAGWRIFTKAGQPGWGVLVPIFNLYLVCKIAGRPGWWALLFFVPLVNVVIGLIIALDVARVFGKGTGFGLGLWILGFVFVPILGFGSVQYTKPGGLAI